MSKPEVQRDQKTGRRFVVVQLSRPVAAHGETLSELTLHEPTAGDLEEADEANGPIAKVNRVIAAVAQVPYPVVRTLPLADFERCSDALVELGFTGPSTEG